MTTDTSWFVLEEAFHSSLFNFFDILKVAASDPEVQCEAGQYFNIAWELKNDLSHFGEYICKSPASLLSEAQKELVLRLIADLESIPAELLVADATMEGNISAMRHPAWDRVRTQAATLSQILEPLNHTNTEFFNRGS